MLRVTAGVENLLDQAYKYHASGVVGRQGIRLALIGDGSGGDAPAGC